jgi:hypothetical protein
VTWGENDRECIYEKLLEDEGLMKTKSERFHAADLRNVTRTWEKIRDGKDGMSADDVEKARHGILIQGDPATELG